MVRKLGRYPYSSYTTFVEQHYSIVCLKHSVMFTQFLNIGKEKESRIIEQIQTIIDANAKYKMIMRTLFLLWVSVKSKILDNMAICYQVD